MTVSGTTGSAKSVHLYGGVGDGGKVERGMERKWALNPDLL